MEVGKSRESAPFRLVFVLLLRLCRSFEVRAPQNLLTDLDLLNVPHTCC